DKPHGKIVVEIYHHRSVEPNATFTLKANQDIYWYVFFRNQFDWLWKSCEESGRVEHILPVAHG
ncbi:MAG: hypothetical protein KKD28_09040, partial [Chloroflexi bacterium]|nr:hypothetical protein [Chloroflexota bacterium]